MKTVTVYSSQPVSDSRLACALLGLECRGLLVQQRPLTELTPARRLLAQEQELLAVTQRLAAIGDRLTAADVGLVRLGVGEGPGLRAEADDLRSRQRGLLVTIQALKGGVGNGY